MTAPSQPKAEIGDTPTRSKFRIPKRWLILAFYFLLGSGAALAGVSLVPAARANVGPVGISAKANIGAAETVVGIPPFGSATASTHKGPLKLTFVLDELNPRILGSSEFVRASESELVELLETGLQQTARRLGVRILIAGTLLGTLFVALLPGRKVRSITAGGLGGLAAIALVLFVASRSFDITAFAEPRFTGALERAPQLIQGFQNQAGNLDDVRSRFKTAAEQLSGVLALAAEPVDNPHAGTVAILHVSDIHSNPIGMEIVRQLATKFRVDAIIDTGDLTSFGDPIEGKIAALIPSAGAPYLFVPGNHDSQENRTAISATPNLVLLHDSVQDVAGVKVMGWADPAFTASNETSGEQGDEANRKQASMLAKRVAELEPDILAVHNPLLAGKSFGETPLILAGHRHKQATSTRRGTAILEVGSAGATGLGSFLVDSNLDYEAEIIYLRERKAVAVDYVKFRSLGADFEIQRTTLPQK